MTFKYEGKTYYDGRETAEYFGVCYETIRAQSAGGVIPFTKIGNKRLYLIEDVRAILVKPHKGIVRNGNNDEVEL